MSWPVFWPGGEPPATANAEQVALAETYAVNTLRFLTLYRVGGDPVTVMPCARTCRRPLMRASLFSPVPFYPSATDLRSCGCSVGCGCSGVGGVELDIPIGRIDEVKINGTVLDPSAYLVIDGHTLVRKDHTNWPSCAGKDFTVTYLNSYPVDEMGQFVAGMLAEEFIKAMLSDKKCRLPSTITSMARAGISYDLTKGMFTDGVTGIPEVDAWIVLWNPYGLRTRPAVYSPDLPHAHQVTLGSW